MTPEEEQLLLKDICARLPYGVTADCVGEHIKIKYVDPNLGMAYISNYNAATKWESIEVIKPYLRSMLSMTEDEKKVYHKLLQMSVTVVEPNSVRKIPMYIVDLEDDGDGLNHLYDWLNKNHFDYRGLIPMGLALEAPEKMYES